MDTSTSGVASSTQQGGTKNPDPLYSSYRFTISKEANNGIEEIDTDLLTQQDYTIATHFVKVKRSGTLTDVTTLWDLVGTEAVSGSLEDLDSRPGFDRLPSINAFDKVGVLYRVKPQNNGHAWDPAFVASFGGYFV